MDAVEEQAHNVAAADRTAIQPQLDQIATDLRAAMQEAGLDFEICLCLPSSGKAIMNILTPADPPRSMGQSHNHADRHSGEAFGWSEAEAGSS